MQNSQIPESVRTRAARQSNIELLRILAACGVIMQHITNPGIGGGIRFVPPGSLNQSLLTVFQVGMICAVNLFVLITGYFLRDSKKRDLLKPIELLAQLFVFELLFFCIKALPKGDFSFRTLLGFYTPHYWFIIVYIALYLISPYINALWRRLASREKKILLALVIGLFSIYPILLDMIGYLMDDPLRGTSTVGLEGTQAGYTIVNFVMMYLIGCAIRDWEEQHPERKTKAWKLVLLLALNIGILSLWTFIEKYLIIRGSTLAIPWRYQNPLVVTEAILYFLLFRRIRIGNNRVINALAAASFPSYLIHINLLEYCSIEKGVQRPPLLMVVHLFCVIAALYLISFLLYRLYLLAAGPIFRAIRQRWKRHRVYRVE